VKNISSSEREQLLIYYDYLPGRTMGNDSFQLLQGISDIYQKTLTTAKNNSILYYWMEGIRKFAPVFHNGSKKLILTAHPEVLLKNKIYNLHLSFPEKFNVRLLGKRGLGYIDDIEWGKRLALIEALSLGKTGMTKNPVYIMSKDSLENLPDGAWFYAPGNRLQKSRENFSSLINEFDIVSSHVKGPGIFLTHLPPSLSHPYFLKLYYDRSIRKNSFSRFHDTWNEVSNQNFIMSELDAYHMMTTSFLVDQ
jgi:hypothetical protein